MSICIYCLEEIKGQQTREHLFPANLHCEDILPNGYVCDKCNNYFADMDKAFLLNNYMALTIATEEIPNRNGKIRYNLSDRVHYLGNRKFALALEPVNILKTNPATIKITQSKEFDELLFARAVHKIAFNCLAYLDGQEVLNYRYNKLRNYIRKAGKGELWTYAVWPYPSTDLVCEFHETNLSLIAHLKILCFDFIVSLEGWRTEFEKILPQQQEVYIIREVGQWQASNLLGLRHAK